MFSVRWMIGSGPGRRAAVRPCARRGGLRELGAARDTAAAGVVAQVSHLGFRGTGHEWNPSASVSGQVRRVWRGARGGIDGRVGSGDAPGDVR